MPKPNKISWKVALKTVILAIRKEPMRNGDWLIETKLPKSSFEVYREYLQGVGLIEKNEHTEKWIWKDDFKHCLPLEPEAYLRHSQYLVEKYRIVEKSPPLTSTHKLYHDAVELFEFIDSFSQWFDKERVEDHFSYTTEILDYGCFPDEGESTAYKSFLRLLSCDFHTESLLEHLINDHTFRAQYDKIVKSIQRIHRNFDKYRKDFSKMIDDHVDISDLTRSEKGAVRDLYHRTTLFILNRTFSDKQLIMSMDYSINCSSPSFLELFEYIGLSSDEALPIINRLIEDNQRMFGGKRGTLPFLYNDIQALLRRMEHLFARLELGNPFPGECQLCRQEKIQDSVAE